MLTEILDEMLGTAHGSHAKSDKHVQLVEELKKELSSEDHGQIHSLIIIGVSDKGQMMALEPDIQKVGFKNCYRLREAFEMATKHFEHMAYNVEKLTPEEKKQLAEDAEKSRVALLKKSAEKPEGSNAS